MAVDKRKLLASISIFQTLPERDLEPLLEITTTRRLAKREYLCRKGDPGNQLYAIMEGRLRAIAESQEGKDVVFSIMDPGEVIGEIAMLDGEPRSATVQAVEDSTLLTLHRRDLLPFLGSRPAVAIELAEVLARRLRHLSELMEDTQFLTLPSRLAKKLVALSATYGHETPKGLRIELRLPQAELGELVGTSRESINKQLRAWSENGLLQFDRGYITICDRDGLEEMARMLVS